MARTPFGLLEEPETRMPSKVRLAFIVLFVVLLILSVVFISLYAVERNKSSTEGSTSKKRQPNGTNLTTSLPPNTTQPTGKPRHSTTGKSTHGTTQQTNHSTTEHTGSTTRPTPSTKTCSSPACVISAADILNKLDESTKPCDDFYQYSCGGFLKKTRLPDGKPLVDSFTVVIDYVQYSLRELLQNERLMSNYSEESAVYKAFTYYKSCMNESYIKNAGIKPILDVIEKYGSWNITNEHWTGDSWILEKILARVLVDLKTPAFLDVDIRPYFFNTSEIFITISGGISGYERLVDKKQSRSRLPQKHLKVEDNDAFKVYRKLMSTVFKLLGSNSTIDEEVNRIVDLEKDFLIVEDSLDPTDLKNLRKNIKFMTINELNNFTSFKFNWTMYFEEVLHGTNTSFPASDQKLMIFLPDNVKKIVHWLKDKPKSLLANDIIWNVIRGLINALPLAFREAQEKYIQSLANTKSTVPRWKTCTRLTNSYFEYATTLLYVNEHLSEGARKAAAEMFTEIKGQFIDGLKEQTWMDNATRAQARLKLKKMKEWIGFPSFIKDPVKLNRFYENVEVNQSRLLQNTLSVFRDQVLKKINQLGKPPNNSRFPIPPLTVNAFYNPSANGMTVLAGILQSPFYKGDNLKALNYGSLGMIVGHEITHGFDKQGSEYDENGNIRQWWTKKSHENFVKRSTCLIEEYNKVKIFGYKVNGNQTLSENIADNGGLKYAFRAYQKWRDIHGNEDKLPALSFNNDQLFFIGFAQLWCAKYTKEGAKYLMDFDSHSLDPVRVRVPLSNFPEFSKAFECPLPKNACTVW